MAVQASCASVFPTQGKVGLIVVEVILFELNHLIVTTLVVHMTAFATLTLVGVKPRLVLYFPANTIVTVHASLGFYAAAH